MSPPARRQLNRGGASGPPPGARPLNRTPTIRAPCRLRAAFRSGASPALGPSAIFSTPPRCFPDSAPRTPRCPSLAMAAASAARDRRSGALNALANSGPNPGRRSTGAAQDLVQAIRFTSSAERRRQPLLAALVPFRATRVVAVLVNSDRPRLPALHLEGRGRGRACRARAMIAAWLGCSRPRPGGACYENGASPPRHPLRRAAFRPLVAFARAGGAHSDAPLVANESPPRARGRAIICRGPPKARDPDRARGQGIIAAYAFRPCRPIRARLGGSRLPRSSRYPCAQDPLAPYHAQIRCGRRAPRSRQRRHRDGGGARDEAARGPASRRRRD